MIEFAKRLKFTLRYSEKYLWNVALQCYGVWLVSCVFGYFMSSDDIENYLFVTATVFVTITVSIATVILIQLYRSNKQLRGLVWRREHLHLDCPTCNIIAEGGSAYDGMCIEHHRDWEKYV